MFMVVSFPWPTQSAYAQLKRRGSAGDAVARQDARTDAEVQRELATAADRG